MSAYYNEHDQSAAAWLRELVKAGLIADGEVDERSIVDVAPQDLEGFSQCHFFAGIGGWSYALRLAGWADTRPVWTGSCPCQPFSAAGKGEGGRDDRHLWPHWARLIRECRPVAVFGEQVESAIAHGWLDLVSDDLEREGYAIGAACVPAASVGAPHRRQRLWFVAELAHAANGGQQSEPHTRPVQLQPTVEGAAQLREQLSHRSATELSGVADTQHAERRSQRERGVDGCDGPHTGRQEAHGELGTCGEVCAPWSRLDWLPCRDGKSRPTQPGLLPLAHGVSARVGRLRGYGNAIVPQVAAEVIRAYMEVA